LSAWRYSSLGCNDTATLYVSTNISVDEIADNQKIEVYPNPTTEKVRINLVGDHFDDNSELNIELATLTGEVIFTKTSRGKEAEFDLSLLPNGAYIFRIKTNQGMHMERVLKTK
jgi:hypothetical protein